MTRPRLVLGRYADQSDLDICSTSDGSDGAGLHTLGLTDCGVHAPKVNVNRSDRPPGTRFNTRLGVADIAHPPAVPVFGKVTSIKTPAGTTIHMLSTETGHILVGKNDSGDELTVVVSGSTTIALSWGDIYDAVSKGCQGAWRIAWLW